MGLDFIHDLTSSEEYSLRVELEDGSGNVRAVTYPWFRIADGEANYALDLEGPEESDLGWSAAALANLRSGATFSTFEAVSDAYPHDNRGTNCTVDGDNLPEPGW